MVKYCYSDVLWPIEQTFLWYVYCLRIHCKHVTTKFCSWSQYDTILQIWPKLTKRTCMLWYQIMSVVLNCKYIGKKLELNTKRFIKFWGHNLCSRAVQYCFSANMAASLVYWVPGESVYVWLWSPSWRPECPCPPTICLWRDIFIIKCECLRMSKKCNNPWRQSGGPHRTVSGFNNICARACYTSLGDFEGVCVVCGEEGDVLRGPTASLFSQKWVSEYIYYDRESIYSSLSDKLRNIDLI